MAQTKDERVEIERVASNQGYGQSLKGYGSVMRTKADELSIWQSLRRNKLIGLIAMAAAFSAALDGYRKATEATANIQCLETD